MLKWAESKKVHIDTKAADMMSLPFGNNKSILSRGMGHRMVCYDKELKEEALSSQMMLQVSGITRSRNKFLLFIFVAGGIIYATKRNYQ